MKAVITENLQDLKEDGSELRMQPLPIQLTETKDPQVRELAFAAQKYGAASVRDPGDFEAIYNHGLALQELALRCSETRENQEILLRQVNSFTSHHSDNGIVFL